MPSILLSALAGGLQGASKGMDSMQEAQRLRVAQARQQMLDQLAQQNTDTDNKRQAADQNLRAAALGATMGPDGSVVSIDPTKGEAYKQFMAEMNYKRSQQDADEQEAYTTLLQTTNRRTGQLYTPSEAKLLSKGGTAGLREAVFAQPEKPSIVQSQDGIFQVGPDGTAKPITYGGKTVMPRVSASGTDPRLTGLKAQGAAINQQMGSLRGASTAAQKVVTAGIPWQGSHSDSVTFKAAGDSLKSYGSQMDQLRHRQAAITDQMAKLPIQGQVVNPDTGTPDFTGTSPVPAGSDPTIVAARAKALYTHLKATHPTMDDGVIRGAVAKELEREGHSVVNQ